MYKVRTTLTLVDGLGDQVLDELVLLFETHAQDCTCGIVQNQVLGYVDEDMLSAVTTLLLKHVSTVEVKLATEDESLEFA